MEANITGTNFEDKLILDIEIFNTLKTYTRVATREEMLQLIQSYIDNAEECLTDYRTTYFCPPHDCKEQEGRP